MARGSSPHTRGARCYLKGEYHALRIIPAYAGSTIVVRFSESRPGDHPRIRGEHHQTSISDATSRGSSPHTRGARGRGGGRRAQAGIIPAYAGSTSKRSWPTSPSADHPRIRGEHTGVTDTGTLAAGSSPHTRGAQQLALIKPGDLGIIPAYAGSTNLPAMTRSRRRDHPRIRGEHIPGPSTT